MNESQLPGEFLCGCTTEEKKDYSMQVGKDGVLTSKRFDLQGYEICPEHGKRLVGWLSVEQRKPRLKTRWKPVAGVDHRDIRDPQTVGRESS